MWNSSTKLKSNQHASGQASNSKNPSKIEQFNVVPEWLKQNEVQSLRLPHSVPKNNAGTTQVVSPEENQKSVTVSDKKLEEVVPFLRKPVGKLGQNVPEVEPSGSMSQSLSGTMKCSRDNELRKPRMVQANIFQKSLKSIEIQNERTQKPDLSKPVDLLDCKSIEKELLKSLKSIEPTQKDLSKSADLLDCKSIEKELLKSLKSIEPTQKDLSKSADLLDCKSIEKELLNTPKNNFRQGGSRGQRFTVESNHIALKISPKFETAFHYDVSINPEKKQLNRKIWETFRRLNLKNYPVAFDGVKNAYSPKYLFENFSETVKIPNENNSKEMSFEVKMKLASEVNLRMLFEYINNGCVTAIPQEALQCVDIVLRNLCDVKSTRVGRCFFSEPRGRVVQLGDGVELWQGHFQSAVIGWKPFLNIDVANKGFPTPQPVIDLMAELSDSNLEYIDDESMTKIQKFLRGSKVSYQISNQSTTRRIFRVNGLGNTAEKTGFVDQKGQRTNVLQYFAQDKNYRIKFPHLPLLWVGSRDKKIYVPAELCTIVAGQVTNKDLNANQLSNLIRNATTSTKTRKEKILNSLQQINFNDDPIVKAFGLSVGNEFEKIPARLLSPPSLKYKNQKIIQPQKGVWRADVFFQPQNLESKSWTIITLDRRMKNDCLENFARMMAQNAKQLGMEIGRPLRPYPILERLNSNTLKDILMDYKDLKMIFVVIPEYPLKIYDQVKQKAELIVGTITQCLKSKTLFKMNQSTVINILQKVNAKLNGCNHIIANINRPPCFKNPCIIMGADVTHPPPDNKDFPSIAAVTASYDPSAFQYNFRWRLQPSRQEIILDLETIVREQLIYFRKVSGQIPGRIFFFRDGVSEGQFTQVMNEELKAIRKACSSLGTPGSYKPPITFLVVQKRHHTRFFPTNPYESDDKFGNVRAGTVVDTHITHPADIEYYLVSHASIQGVARPTKYRVLWDDCDTSEDELEALTYYLCHLFSRCTRSVSYPAPTYYAHLAALRARAYLDRQNINLEELEQEQKILTVKDKIVKENPMFFV